MTASGESAGAIAAHCSLSHPPPSISHLASFQVVVACDMLQGVFAVLVYKGHIDADIFLLFFQLVVLPRIAGTGPRFLMLDNASWHDEDRLRTAAAASGHRLGFRPVHSPDFGFVESTISHAEGVLQEHKESITRENFADWIRAAFESIGALLVQGFAHDTHYVVPGRLHKPYFGQQ